MIQENEIVMLALGIGVYFFVVANKSHLERTPDWKILLFAYRILLAAWVLTVFEGLFLAEVLNVLEHFGYACSTLAMAIWCWRITLTGKRREK